jgi:hypothetical protein
MTRRCAHPLPFGELVDYHAGELAAPDEARVEDHVFACAVCTERLGAVAQLAGAIAGYVARGQVMVSGTRALVDQLAARGLTIRTYVVTPGQQVPCTAAPGDDLVLIQLAGAFAARDALMLEVVMDDLDAGTQLQRELAEVPFDQRAGDLHLLFPGERVRAYPRSRWTIRVHTGGPGARALLGTFALEHTPWERVERPA